MPPFSSASFAAAASVSDWATSSTRREDKAVRREEDGSSGFTEVVEGFLQQHVDASGELLGCNLAEEDELWRFV